MSSQALRSILSRWECSPPAIGAAEANGDFRHVFPMLRKHSIVRPIIPAASIECSDCGELRRVNYVYGTGGDRHGFISCSQCGSLEVSGDSLARWEIDTAAFLTTAFQGTRLSVQERVSGQLWQVGKGNWACRTREVWFARSCRVDAVDTAVNALAGRPKAILFVPTETAIGYWQDAVENLVLSMEQALIFDGQCFAVDTEYVESRLIDAGLAVSVPPKKRPKKRSGRAAKIEALKIELMKHLREARDHAFHSKQATGVPELLPRPTQRELALRVGISETDVSRCFKDPQARELKYCWDLAYDLNRIMEWNGPISKGRT